MCEATWLPFSVYSSCKLLSSPQQVFNEMTNLQKARLELSELQLLKIENQIKTWNTKDKVINLMRYRYGRVDEQAA